MAPLTARSESAVRPKARVAIATSSEHAGRKDDVPADAVNRLVDAAVASVVMASAPADAWKRLFSPGDRVAVKVNTLAGPQLSTHPSVVEAVLRGLISAGVGGDRIVVFDRSEKEMSRAGFTVGRDARGVTCTGTDAVSVGYRGELVVSGSTASLWSSVITDFATVIVNVPVLKDHDLSGVSLGMKNFFGVIHNPNKYHDNGCDPYIADVCGNRLVTGKLRLIVIDCLRAQADGGPAYRQDGSYPYAGVIAGVDPVAVDATGWSEIENLRKQLGYKPLKDAGREPRHILTAAERGLGVAAADQIDAVRLPV